MNLEEKNRNFKLYIFFLYYHFFKIYNKKNINNNYEDFFYFQGKII